MCPWGFTEGTDVVASIVSCLLYSNRKSQWNWEKTACLSLAFLIAPQRVSPAEGRRR